MVTAEGLYNSRNSLVLTVSPSGKLQLTPAPLLPNTSEPAMRGAVGAPKYSDRSATIGMSLVSTLAIPLAPRKSLSLMLARLSPATTIVLLPSPSPVRPKKLAVTRVGIVLGLRMDRKVWRRLTVVPSAKIQVVAGVFVPARVVMP